MGSVGIAIAPARMITSEQTVARIGRWMKVSTNIGGSVLDTRCSMFDVRGLSAVARSAQRAVWIAHGAFHENRLCLVVDMRRDEIDRRRSELLLAVAAENADRQSDLQRGRALRRYRHIHLQRVVLVDGREHGGGRDLV